MNKFKKRLSKWFLDTAKKLDEKTVMNDSFTIPLSTQPIIMYDEYHIDKIHAQHMIDNIILDAYKHNIRLNVEEMIKHKLVEEISKMIYDSHKDEVKETFYNESTIFSLDICVCKPQKKESL